MAKTYLEVEKEDGSFLKFKKDGIKARWMRKVFELEKDLNELGKKGSYAAALDLKIRFVVDLFNDEKLTEDVIYDGVDSDKITSELDRIIADVVGNPKEGEPGKL